MRGKKDVPIGVRPFSVGSDVSCRFRAFSVFLLCRHSPAYVALLLILLQDRLDLFMKLRIHLFEPYRNILMNRTFTDSENLSGVSYRCLCGNNIFCEAYTSFLFCSIGGIFRGVLVFL